MNYISIIRFFIFTAFILNSQFFNNSADKLPVTLILLISVFDFFVFITFSNIFNLVAYWLIMIIPRGAICAWNHHHQHRNVFNYTVLNRILEFFYALQTGVTTNLWLLHHNFGHHKNYLDQTIDESRWKRKNGTTMGELEYTLSVALTAYTRGYQVGKNFPKHQRNFIIFSALTFFIVAILTVINPLNALFVFILPMISSLLYTAMVTYSHHANLDTNDVFKASYNKTNRWYNLFTGNLGYHTAHHYKQGVHWSELPKLHEQIKHHIPDNLILN